MSKVNELKKSRTTYYMERWIIGFRFKTMIYMGSLVTIFAVDKIYKIMRWKHLRVRRMVKGEKYVDFNGKHLYLLEKFGTRQ